MHSTTHRILTSAFPPLPSCPHLRHPLSPLPPPQPVYNANKLARLDSRREWVENRLTFNSIRLEKHPAVRPTHTVGGLGEGGGARGKQGGGREGISGAPTLFLQHLLGDGGVRGASTREDGCV